MAIKWKKSKNLMSFGIFFTGVSLTILGGAGMLSNIVYQRGNSGTAQGIFEEDYQKSERFQNYMEARLEEFLAVSSGEMLWDSYWYYGNDDSEWTEYGNEITMSTGSAIEDNPTENWESEYGWADRSGANHEISPEDAEAMAKKFHEAIKGDKNLLYCITFAGKELFSNMEEIKDWEGDANQLPEGYNFLLSFDGKEVKIIKDQKEQDIYGDGYYREQEGWNVPGYKNFQVPEKWEDVKIVMLAAEEPVLYSYYGYNRYNNPYSQNELYFIARDLAWTHANNIRYGIFLAAGMLTLLVSWFFRKGKREADQALAVFTGRIWIEAKLLALAAFLGSFMYRSGNYYGSGSYWEIYYGVTNAYESGVTEGTAIFSEVLPWLFQDFFWDLLRYPEMLAILFWIIYLLANDIRKNKKSWKHGLISKVSANFRTKNLKLPLAKRLIRRLVPVLVISIGVGAFVFLVICFNSAVTYNPIPFVWCGVIWLLVMTGTAFCYLSWTRKMAVELDILADRITAVHDGDYSGEGLMPKDADLKKMAEELDDIRQGMEAAIDEHLKSDRMKVELVANVSHDIKTPLTSIISYVQFLKQEEDLPEHVKDYIRVLDEKSERLKNMVQDVFSVSKAAAGQLSVDFEELDFGKLLRQTLADMDEQINHSPVLVKAEIPEAAVFIRADGQRMYRVFQNLIQNALKYSLEGSRVYVTLKEEGELAVASIKNTSKQELARELDFTERFTRGDESRTDGGTGLGLSIAKSFTEACGGSFKLETIADLFLVTVSFAKIDTQQ